MTPREDNKMDHQHERGARIMSDHVLDKERWDDSVSLAKDQMRHGKITVADLESTAKKIYCKLEFLSIGPVFDVEAITQTSIAAKTHEKTRTHVKCGECGKEFKLLSSKHLKKHSLTRKEYMAKYTIKNIDMSVKVSRKTTKGESNPLTIMSDIMKSYKISRKEVMGFLKKKEFAGIKQLKEFAEENKMNPLKVLYSREDPAVNLLDEKAAVETGGKAEAKKAKK